MLAYLIQKHLILTQEGLTCKWLVGAPEKHRYRLAVSLPRPTALGGLLERINTDFFLL